jgi:hypothetical protein
VVFRVLLRAVFLGESLHFIYVITPAGAGARVLGDGAWVFFQFFYFLSDFLLCFFLVSISFLLFLFFYFLFPFLFFCFSFISFFFFDLFISISIFIFLFLLSFSFFYVYLSVYLFSSGEYFSLSEY